ncbi:MAG: hypothetical protein K8I82_00610, partial [Anaerolineae bacterium]|nr:hypothetical protein [Anaerolineae bacterium]
NFIGTRPVVAHNISFDLGMLKKHQVAQSNLAIDTYDLATILLPTSPRYNLNTLVETFHLQLDNAHRALDDAVAGWQVYRQLWQRILELPMTLLQEIVDNTEGLFWPVGAVFKDALVLRTERGETSTAQMVFDFQPDDHIWTPLTPKETPTPLDTTQITALLGADSPFTGFQPREGQGQMATVICEALNAGEHRVIEAPIGTGHVLAYLLPAAKWALENNERVVIATHRQNGFLHRELTLLNETLGWNVAAATIKDRSEYLNPRKLAALRRYHASTVDELRMLAKVLIWLWQGGSGEKSQLNLRGTDERSAWLRMSEYDSWNEPEPGSPFYKAQARAQAAHLLLVPHDLLLSRQANVIPDYRYIIMDNAHHLEDGLTYGMREVVDKYGLLDSLASMGDIKKGLLKNILKDIDTLPEKAYQKMETYLRIMATAGGEMESLVNKFFNKVVHVAVKDDDGGVFNRQVRVVDGMRKADLWNEVRATWHELGAYIQTLSDSLDKIVNGLRQLYDRYGDEIQHFADLVESIQAASTKLKISHLFLERFVNAPQKNTVYWISHEPTRSQVEICTAPLHLGGLMQKNMWEAKKCAVLISPTLRSIQTFDFIHDRLNTGSIKNVVIPPRFHYKDNTLVYLPTDIPEPNQRQQYRDMIERTLIELATVTEGRMLCLFTSFQQLRETAQNIAPRLALGNIAVYDEASSVNRETMLDNFKTAEKAVLMGTFSSWEGTDEDIQVIVMIRLPFSPPNDPVFAARSETYGDNSFRGYMIPDAVLEFRQGFDQFTRRDNEKRLLVILDKRMTSKPYGQHFIDSLPEVKVQRGGIAQLPKQAKDWLNP